MLTKMSIKGELGVVSEACAIAHVRYTSLPHVKMLTMPMYHASMSNTTNSSPGTLQVAPLSPDIAAEGS